MDQGNCKKADDGLGQSLLVQQQQQQISSGLLFNAPARRGRLSEEDEAAVGQGPPRPLGSLPPLRSEAHLLLAATTTQRRRHHCLDHLGNDRARAATTATRCCYW